jgi:hypothetical protein
MFGLDPVYLGLATGVFVLIEVGLFWAAASLGDAPALSWGKLTPIAVGVAAVWAALIGVTAWQTGLAAELARATASGWQYALTALSGDNRTTAWVVGGISLFAMWAIPSVLYAPLVPVSLARSMRIAVFQVLLRGFAYVLLAAVLMVALAVAQIWTGADVRAMLLP